MSARVIVGAEDIDVFYGSSQILFGVSLEVAEGQTMALLGRNGAGKSTTLKALAGIAPPSRGVVRVLGKEMQGRKPHTIARAGIGFVPEDRRIFGELSVWENLDVARRAAGRQGRWTMETVFELFPAYTALFPKGFVTAFTTASIPSLSPP